ncbi:MAG: DMT family transporter [Calditrichaceae bacterium]
MDKLAPLFVIIAAMLWGIDGIVLTPSLYGLPVPLVVFVESTVVAVILTPFFIKSFPEFRLLKEKDWLAFIGVALFGGAIGTMAITRALFYVNFVNLSIVVLIQKLQPVFALVLATIVLKEKLPKEFYIWAGLAVFGAYFMTFGLKLPNLDSGDKKSMAALFALVASASFAASTVLSKRALRNVSHESGAYLRFLIASLIMTLIVVSSGEITQIGMVNQKQAFIFLLIAFTTGGPAIFLYYYGLKRISASVATICELAFPLTAIILEYLIRGHIMNTMQWIGVGILFIGIIKVSRIKSEVISAS